MTLLEVGNVPSSISIEPNTETLLPLPVRSHTAHVVGSKMIVLFGVSSSAETLISYVQEYDFGKLESDMLLHISGRSILARMFMPSHHILKFERRFVENGSSRGQALW